MKKILVTGANGFFGSSIFKILKEKEYEPIKVTRKSTNASPEEIFCNFQSIENIEKVLITYKPNGIIHCIGSFSNDFLQDFEANIVTTWNLLSTLLRISP